VTFSLLSAYILIVSHKVFTEERLINKKCVQERDNINLCLNAIFH